MSDSLYDLGLDGADTTVDGWALYLGSDGESPQFVSFHTSENDADEARRACVEQELTSPCVVIAIVCEHGIICANDYKITTHAQLRQLACEYKP